MDEASAQLPSELLAVYKTSMFPSSLVMHPEQCWLRYKDAAPAVAGKWTRNSVASSVLHSVAICKMDGRLVSITTETPHVSAKRVVGNISRDGKSRNVLFSSLLSSSAKLQTIPTLLLKRRVAEDRQGPTSVWGEGSARDACTLAAVWSVGHRDDSYQSRKVSQQILLFTFEAHTAVACQHLTGVSLASSMQVHALKMSLWMVFLNRHLIPCSEIPSTKTCTYL